MVKSGGRTAEEGRNQVGQSEARENLTANLKRSGQKIKIQERNKVVRQ